MGGRPAPERSARPQGGADLRHLAHRGDTRGRGGMELACRPAACRRPAEPSPLISCSGFLPSSSAFEV